MPDNGDTAISFRYPYLQIADRLRDRIHAGEYKPGDQLPTIPELMTEFKVSRATAHKAVSLLQAEHAVWSDNRGTFVSGDDVLIRTPGDRLRGPLHAQVGLGEAVTVDEAGIVTAPDYVAALLDVTPGAQVIRRQERTWRNGRVVVFSVDWIPGDSHYLLAAELTDRRPVEGGAARVVQSVTRRTITRARDHLRARGCDAREAKALNLDPGDPVLAGAHTWGDDDGILIYGEWCILPDVVISYEYEVAT
jgi:GntR family transcriptional regulator